MSGSPFPYAAVHNWFRWGTVQLANKDGKLHAGFGVDSVGWKIRALVAHYLVLVRDQCHSTGPLIDLPGSHGRSCKDGESNPATSQSTYKPAVERWNSPYVEAWWLKL